jgi:ribosomal protein S4E
MESKIVLDNDTRKKLILRIYQEERNNYKTNKLRKNEMIDRVRKIIEFEVGKNDN